MTFSMNIESVTIDGPFASIKVVLCDTSDLPMMYRCRDYPKSCPVGKGDQLTSHNSSFLRWVFMQHLVAQWHQHVGLHRRTQDLTKGGTSKYNPQPTFPTIFWEVKNLFCSMG